MRGAEVAPFSAAAISTGFDSVAGTCGPKNGAADRPKPTSRGEPATGTCGNGDAAVRFCGGRIADTILSVTD